MESGHEQMVSNDANRGCDASQTTAGHAKRAARQLPMAMLQLHLDPDLDIDSDHDDQHPEHDNNHNYYLFFLISILALYQLSSNVSGNHRPVECYSNGTAGYRPGRFKLEGTLRVLMELLNMSCILSLPLPLLPSAHER